MYHVVGPAPWYRRGYAARAETEGGKESSQPQVAVGVEALVGCPLRLVVVMKIAAVVAGPIVGN